MKTLQRKHYAVMVSTHNLNTRGRVDWSVYGQFHQNYDDALMEVLALSPGLYEATRVIGVELPAFVIDDDDEPLFGAVVVNPDSDPDINPLAKQD